MRVWGQGAEGKGSGVWGRQRGLQSPLQGEATVACVIPSRGLMLWCLFGQVFGFGGGVEDGGSCAQEVTSGVQTAGQGLQQP